MYNSKLIHILKVLTSEEKERLRKWVYSPAHNHREDRQKLFTYLLNKRKLSPTTSNRYKVYQYIYPETPYNDAKLKRLMNLGVQLLEDFIYFSVQRKDHFSQQKALVNFFKIHGLDKYVQQYIHKIQQIQKYKTLGNSQYFTQQYELEQFIFERQSSTISRETNLQAIFDNRYLSFVLDSLHYACTAATHQRLYNSEYKIPLLQQILTDIKTGHYQEIPAVQLYYYSYMSLIAPKEEQYFELLQRLMFAHYNVLPAKEMKGIYLIAINYCIQKLNNGIEKYVRAVFELYQYGLERHILIENETLSRFAYKNIVSAAIRLKAYQWVKNFIKTYTPLLDEDYQKPYGLYAKAKLSFAQGNFDHTLELLTQVEFDNLFLNMDAKIMLLKIYYERGYFDVLDAFLVSFKRFLQRKSILAYQRRIHENMISITTKLLNIPSYDKHKLQTLRQEIEQTNPLTEKPWLLEQLDKL